MPRGTGTCGAGGKWLPKRSSGGPAASCADVSQFPDRSKRDSRQIRTEPGENLVVDRARPASQRFGIDLFFPLPA